MKKSVWVRLVSVMVAMLLLLPAACAEGEDSFLSLSGLGKMEEKLADGVEIIRVFYDDRGEYISEFTTANPEETGKLWEAFAKITVAGPAGEGSSGAEPVIVFYLSDGSAYTVYFAGHQLLAADGKKYALGNDSEFWELTSSLTEKYAGTEAGGPVDGGWGTATGTEIPESVLALFERATDGELAKNYVPYTYLGMQVVAGYNHAVLCQALGTPRRWVVVYLFEDLDGGVEVTGIRDLRW